MSVPLIKTSFVTGEVAPSLFGHTDLARFQSAASTMRNFFVSYRGGAYSRAGTAFVGFSKQTGRTFPPRLIQFQFSTNQGLALEFGNFYMRVISNGAFVVGNGVTISAITKANPAVITASATGGTAASANNGAVSLSYAPGDQVTLAGGTFVTPMILGVTNTLLLSLQSSGTGAGYVPGDTIHPSGGTQSTASIVTITNTQIASAVINAAGTTGIAGPQVVTGTTGTGTKFQLNVTVVGGAIVSIDSISFPGTYTVNPTSLAAEPVTGGGLTGATVTITMCPNVLAVTTAGVFTHNPGSTMGQTSTSGAGTGATFNSPLMAPNALSVVNAGSYTAFPANPVAQASTTGGGLGVTFTVTTGAAASFNTGDWVALTGLGGMTQLNGLTVVLTKLTASTYSLQDVYGNNIDSTLFSTYTGGGIAEWIFTLTTQYAEADLKWLKWVQSADVMSLCCVNQDTGTEYPPVDLGRVSDTNWTFTPVVATATATAPASVTLAHTAAGTVTYQYGVTSVSPIDGTESELSPIATIKSSVDIANTAGSITITWTPVAGVLAYNIYKAQPAYANAAIPAGALFGFAGSAYGSQFQDNNIVADMTQVPPQHKDPFSRGQVQSATPLTGGSGYTSITLTINTSTGSGAVLVPVIVNGALSAIIMTNPGINYAPTDTITVTGVAGTGATATIAIGPQIGTYPSTVSYIQQRRVYADSLNQPDTYWMSQPGAYRNFDSRIPTIASDAIIGTPWAVQVNGIQFMVPMPGGLVILTGLSAWQLTGVGGSSLNPQPITPSTQQAQPQAYNGCSSTVPPLRVDQEILYVQAKGSIYRDLSYNYFTNIYTGADITENSSHLFTGFTMLEHAYCEEPFKVIWSVRNDGILLSLTYLKTEQVQGWARHDTFGLFKTVCSVTEPPVDALYMGVQRFIGANTAYVIERMNDRIWGGVEDSWCVDCGATLPQPMPAATLTASSPTGLGSLTGVTSLVGGQNYSATTTATVMDDGGTGPGTGAVVSLTIAAGVITAIAFTSPGSGYINPALVIVDPTNAGTGASAHITLNNAATFTASAAVFSAGNVGSVIRMGGGIATITVFTNSTHVVANITSPITQVFPNAPTPTVIPQVSGSWTMTAPVTTVAGFQYLAGATIVGIVDGNPIPAQVVPASGTITLPVAGTSGTFGLGFTAQLQSVYVDAGSPTVQGQRKKVAAVTARLESTRGLQIGSNQVDASTLSPYQLVANWVNLDNVVDHAKTPYNSGTEPLYTGDTRIPVQGGFQTAGQVCIQQALPLPAGILAFIPELLPGDLPENQVSPRQKQQAQAQGRQ